MGLIALESAADSVEALVAGFRISPDLERCLADLEDRIDPDIEASLLSGYRSFLDGRCADPVFAPRRPAGIAPGMAWPPVTVNQALHDFNRMALQQFGACRRLLAQGGGAPLAIRANYGVCISSAWFGCPVYMMADGTETLPTSRPLEDRSRMDDLVATGRPDVTAGYGARVFAMGHIFRNILNDYPRIRRHVHVYHPDFQSPIDTCELVWGSDMLLALYECPARVHRLLNLMTDTYIAAVRAWSVLHPFSRDLNAHWHWMHRGNIFLRTDSGMNLSPGMYDEFIRPYEQRCLDACGGGAIHFCGRGDHFIASMTRQRGLSAIHLSQPECNDMETIFRHTVDCGIALLGLPHAVAQSALDAGRALHGRVWVVPG